MYLNVITEELLTSKSYILEFLPETMKMLCLNFQTSHQNPNDQHSEQNTHWYKKDNIIIFNFIVHFTLVILRT